MLQRATRIGRGFALLFANSNFKADCGNFIKYNLYGTKGYCFYCFDFGDEMSGSSDHVTPKKIGTAKLNFSFAKASNPALKVLLYAEFAEMLEINALRNVTRNYQL